MEPTDKRSRLVQAAAKTIYERGYRRTTLAHIAEAAGVPVGNVYYYFKTKEELGHALIEHRLESHRAMRESLEAIPGPKARIEAFIRATCDGSEMLAQSGCPIGSLCSELRKDDGALGRDASRPLAEYLAWLEAQFRALGCGDEPGAHAAQLMSSLQGATLLAHSFEDPEYVEREAKRLIEWVHSIGARANDGQERNDFE